jgi:formylglycine-generating enzyme required for sulfatase activity
VSWNDSVGFCDWLSKQEGKHYRLPTEAEWEYAARAGTQTTWWWGDNPDDGAGAANLFDATCKARFVTGWTGIFNWSDGYCFTSPVGRFKPNAWGLYDMIGNACEWCSDWYGDYPKGDATDPQGPTSGQDRVARGSSWSDVSRTSRCAMRCHAAPSARNDHLGLRLVLDAG